MHQPIFDSSLVFVDDPLSNELSIIDGMRNLVISSRQKDEETITKPIIDPSLEFVEDPLNVLSIIDRQKDAAETISKPK